uniref:Uncharacterized protein n=1 Tax=Ascaris lumbricoides TaxID=6252 RepID=A0A9J2Q299_ASCLU
MRRQSTEPQFFTQRCSFSAEPRGSFNTPSLHILLDANQKSRYSVVVVDCGGCDTSMFANKLLRSAGSSLQTGFYQAFTFFAVSRNLATPNKSCYYFFAFIFIIIITYQL